jgi:integrase
MVTMAARARLRAVASQQQEVLLQPYEAFLRWVERERSPRTHQDYAHVLRDFEAAFPDPFTVTAGQVEAWTRRARPKLGGRPAGPNTQRAEIICLKSLSSFLARHGIETELSIGMPPKPAAVAKSVPRRVLNAVVASEARPDRLMVLLLLADAGLRDCEVCSIPPEALQTMGSRQYLRFIGKGRKERIVPISKRLVSLWRERARMVPPETPICRSSTGALLTAQRCWEYAVDAGLGVGVLSLNPHRWRHSWACWLYFDKSVPLVKVSRLLGHSSIQTTMTYLGVHDAELVEIGDVFDD